MTMTLADRCDNQAIGGLRHIKWDVRGEFMALTLTFSQLKNTAFPTERSVW
jgi:hypothetical protein